MKSGGTKDLAKQVKRLEREIDALEKEIAALDAAIEDAATDYQRLAASLRYLLHKQRLYQDDQP